MARDEQLRFELALTLGNLSMVSSPSSPVVSLSIGLAVVVRRAGRLCVSPDVAVDAAVCRAHP